MNKRSIIITVVLCGCLTGVSNGLQLNPELDFYTPMSTMVTPDRDYLLTSNAHAWLDMGDGLQSFETLLFLKFDSDSLPQEEVSQAWLRLGSGARGTMGETTRPVLVSVHPVDRDISEMLAWTTSPRDFYVFNDHILDSVDSVMVFQDGVCYWDITDIVNNWILYQNTGGAEGYENLGLAVTGRDDAGAMDPNDNKHAGFWSSRANTMPNAARPALFIMEAEKTLDSPWIPDWSDNSGFSIQFWTFSGKDGRLQQGATADGYLENSFGEPYIEWEQEEEFAGSEIINPFLTWHPFADSPEDSEHPDWVGGVYGGVYRAGGGPYDPHTLSAFVPTGYEQGPLTVLVQYDWFDRGDIDVNVSSSFASGQEIFLENGFDLSVGTAGDHNWYRSTRAYEFSDNPGNIEVEFIVWGEEPYIASFSVTTAIDEIIPNGPVRHDHDSNYDGVIDFRDYSVFASEWMQTKPPLFYDITNSGIVEFQDLFIFAESWLHTSLFRYLQQDN